MYLSKYLRTKYNNLDYVSKISIDLVRNEIHDEGVLYIARMLSFIEHLYLSHNPIGDPGASLISEALRETATLKTLILNRCDITSRGAEDLSRALAQNSSLEKLDISWNYLVGGKGISHVAEALKQNKQLKELWIGDCRMTDRGAASLASALTVNNSLEVLHMGGFVGVLTENGLSTIAHSLANNSEFVKLVIPYNFGCATTNRLSSKVPGYITNINDCLSWEVNVIRKSNGLPPIEVEGVLCGCYQFLYSQLMKIIGLYIIKDDSRYGWVFCVASYRLSIIIYITFIHVATTTVSEDIPSQY
jgi:Ran GTPase-activating protein (RanGAP) involved in mRNA processing and transport